MPARRQSSTARRLISVLVTIGCLVILLQFVDLQELVKILGSANVLWLLVAVLVRVFDRLVMIWKWFPLVRLQVPGVSFINAARAYVMSGLAVYLLPISVSSDVIRAATLGRDEEAIPEVGASIIAERLLGMAATGLLCLISLYVALSMSVQLMFVLPWALAAIFLGLVALLAPLSERATLWGLSRIESVRWIPGSGFVRKLAVAYRTYGRHPRLLFAVGLASVFEQSLGIVIAWAIVLALGISVSFWALVVALPLAVFAGRIPVSFGGIGVTEGAIVYLLGLFGVPVAEALALSLIARAIDILVVSVPGAFLWNDIVMGRSESPDKRD